MASISEMASGPSRTFYSVGIDETIGLKDRIADVHGDNSRQVGFIRELEDYLGDNDEYRQASRKFKTFVRRRMNIPQNTDYMIDEFINSGYIMAMERIRAPNSGNDLDFLESYAKTHDMTAPQVILFGPNGTVRQAFSKWIISEALRGQHRSSSRPDNEKMAHVYDSAFGNRKCPNRS